MRLPRNFLKPLVIGAPAPFREMPLRAERMVYFLPPHLKKIRARIPEFIRLSDVLCGNLEDAIPVEDKAAARAGFIEGSGECQPVRRHRALGTRELPQQPVDSRRP